MQLFVENVPLSASLMREAERMIQTMKLVELHRITERLGFRKTGLKQEVQGKILDALRNPTYQKTICVYLDETRKCTNVRVSPYSISQRHYQSANTSDRSYMSNPFLGNSTMNSAQRMLSTTPVPAPRDLRIVPLPFYDVASVIMPPMELAASQTGQKLSARQTFVFKLSDEHMKLINYKLESKALPRYEIQLRFFNTSDLKNPQKDDFPLNVNVRLNDMIVTLPNIIPTNKPNAEPKRPSRPVCVTHITQMFPIATFSNRLMVEWMSDKRSWAVAVYLVYRINTDILFARLFDNSAKHQSIEVTRREIIKKLTGNDDDGIAMDQLKIGLLCPLVKTRMKNPARCLDCTHLQCFDLTSYLMMNEKRPVWNCPVCSGYAPYDRLIIDEYFKDVISKVDDDTVEVELKPDGRFEILQPIDTPDVSDDDEIGVIKHNSVRATSISQQPASTVHSKTFNDKDVIVLSDSDDDESVQNITLPSTSRPDANNPQTPPKKSNNIEIITLDDTPPTKVKSNPKEELQPTSSVPNLSDALATIRGDTVTPSGMYPDETWRPPAPSNNLIGRQFPAVANQVASYNYSNQPQRTNFLGANNVPFVTFPPFWGYTQQYMGSHQQPPKFPDPNGR